MLYSYNHINKDHYWPLRAAGPIFPVDKYLNVSLRVDLIVLTKNEKKKKSGLTLKELIV